MKVQISICDKVEIFKVSDVTITHGVLKYKWECISDPKKNDWDHLESRLNNAVALKLASKYLNK